MEKLTPEQIKAADAILSKVKEAHESKGSWNIASQSDVKHDNPKTFDEDLIIAAKNIQSNGFFTIEAHNEDNRYRLEQKGVEFLRSGKSYGDYLREEAEQEAKRLEKDERDNLHKDLQIQDLITKLNTINPNQLDFWKSQKERNKQATLIAIIAALFSLVAMMKAWGFFG